LRARILIAGGWGLIGSSIATVLREAGHDLDIVLAGRSPDSGKALATRLGASLVRLDVADPAEGCCQSNANPSPLFADEQVLSHEKVAPLAKGGVAFLFKSNSGVNMPFEVEVIVH